MNHGNGQNQTPGLPGSGGQQPPHHHQIIHVPFGQQEERSENAGMQALESNRHHGHFGHEHSGHAPAGHSDKQIAHAGPGGQHVHSHEYPVNSAPQNHPFGDRMPKTGSTMDLDALPYMPSAAYALSQAREMDLSSRMSTTEDSSRQQARGQSVLHRLARMDFDFTPRQNSENTMRGTTGDEALLPAHVLEKQKYLESSDDLYASPPSSPGENRYTQSNEEGGKAAGPSLYKARRMQQHISMRDRKRAKRSGL